MILNLIFFFEGHRFWRPGLVELLAHLQGRACFKCPDTWRVCSSRRRHLVFRSSGLCSYFLFVYIIVFHKENMSQIIYRILALEVPASREKSHIMYVIWFIEPHLLQCNAIYFSLSYCVLNLLLAFSLLNYVERQLSLYKNSFLHLVHKTTYEYDEHSYIFWKKIA